MPVESLNPIQQLSKDTSGQTGSIPEYSQNHEIFHANALLALKKNHITQAIKWLQKAVAVEPHLGLYRRNLAELLRRAGKLDAAIEALKAAIFFEPNCAQNHFLLGLVYNNNRQWALSVSHYRIALSYDPEDSLTWNNLGASLESLEEKGDAKMAYKQAIECDPGNAEAQNNLGALYSEEGELDQARAHFEAALKASPHFMDAHYNLSLIKTYAPDDPHLSLIEANSQKIEAGTILERIRYYFAQGKAWDDIKQYKRAFKAYAEGNRLHYCLHPWNKKKLQDIVEHLPRVFTSTFFQSAQKKQEKQYPIFIVGMPRSGTSLIEQILASHPKVYGAGELGILDEVIQQACNQANRPFNTWIMQLSDQDFIQLGEQYLKKTWNLAPNKNYIVDKMPSNCFYIGMIVRMLPQAKIIHAIRDPMDSCFSCFTHLFKGGMEFAYDLTALGQYYTLYAQAMLHWHAVLPQGAIFDLPYEEIVAQSELVLKQLFNYIGLEWDPNCLLFYKNNRIVKTASFAQVRKPIYSSSVQRWKHFEQELKPLLKIVNPYRNLKELALDQREGISNTLRLAVQYQKEGQLEPAKALLNSILERRPHHAEALHLLAILEYYTEQVELAIHLLKKAINSNPYASLFHSNLGEMYRKLNRIKLSIRSGRRAVELDPNSVTALSNLGVAYYDAKQYKQAEKYHLRALALDSKWKTSLNNLGSIYKEYGDLQKAAEFYQAAILAAPHSAESLNNLGVLLLEQKEFSSALDCFYRAILMDSCSIDAHSNAGAALLGLEDYFRALKHFNKVLELRPDCADAYYGISKIDLYHQDFIPAEKHIRKAITINPKQANFYHQLAMIYNEKGDYESALSYLDQALNIDSTAMNLYLSKGSILMEKGEVEQAEKIFFHVIQYPLLNDRILAHYSLVHLRKIKSDSLSLKELLAIAKAPKNLPGSKLEYVYFALGKCFDDLSEYPRSFEYYAQGAQLKRQRITYNIADQIELTQKLIHCFTKETIEGLKQFANLSALPIFIVGMPRSGSTLVEQILSNHPSVYGAGELSYFHDLFCTPVETKGGVRAYPENILEFSAATFQNMTEQYLSYLQYFSPDAIHITDKMLHNFFSMGLIHALFPNAKIIHIQRDPIDTCLSCYTQLFSQGQLYSYDLTELGIYYNCYQQMMEHWRATLPAGSWIDIQYETLVYNFETEAKRLISFCNLTWDPACLNFHRSKRSVRTASLMQVRQPIYNSSILRWRRFESELQPLIEVLTSNSVKKSQQ